MIEYLFHIGVIFLIYAILVISANLTIGMANLLSMCHAAFYGIGAYLGVFFLSNFNYSFLLVALAVMLLTGVSSMLVTAASIKLKGDYFLLATLGFQMVVYSIIYNCKSLTGGSLGISNAPNVKLMGVYEIDTTLGYFLLLLVVVAAMIVLFELLQRSSFGRLLQAIRCNEIAVEALGTNTAKIKAWAFFLSAAFAGLAGMLFAAYQTCFFPTSFTIDKSIFLIMALFIGGIGRTVWGPVVGALFAVLLPEVLRSIGLPDAMVGNWEQVIYGVTLVVVMFIRPQGLVGDIKLK